MTEYVEHAHFVNKTPIRPQGAASAEKRPPISRDTPKIFRL
jgi:hypothetical protein